MYVSLIRDVVFAERYGSSVTKLAACNFFSASSRVLWKIAETSASGNRSRARMVTISELMW